MSEPSVDPTSDGGWPARAIPGAVAESGVIAILRGGDAEHLAPVCRTLVDSGVRCLEITTNTPGVWQALRDLRAEYGSTVELGVGTVLSRSHVDDAVEAGAGFVVSPDTGAEVGSHAAARGLGWYPGALTPTEILSAWRAGATAVKVFPVSSVGGAEYLRQVRAPLEDIPLIPTGGIAVESAVEYLRAGAVAVGIGGPLLGDALRTGELGPLAERASRLLGALAGSR